MVQVLPYVPSFGEQLVPHIAKAAGDVAKGIESKRARTALEKMMSQSSSPAFHVANPDTAQKLGTGQTSQNELNPSNVLQLYTLAEKAYGPDQAKILANSFIEQKKLQAKEASKIREEERALTSPGNKVFYETIASERESLPEKEVASESIINAINSGETGVFSKANAGAFLESLGAPAQIRQALETPGSKEFKSASKTFLASNMRDAFRGTTTGREINIAEQIGAELGVAENANLAAAFFQQVKVNISKEKIRLVDQLTEEGVPPSKIPAVVDKMLKPFVQEEKKEYFEAVRQLGFK